MNDGRQPLNLSHMTAAQFEENLPELFATHHGRISDDPELREFLESHPDCAALVRDLEYIAEAARQLLEPIEEEPSDNVWKKIQGELKIAASGEDS